MRSPSCSCSSPPSSTGRSAPRCSSQAPTAGGGTAPKPPSRRTSPPSAAPAPPPARSSAPRPPAGSARNTLRGSPSPRSPARWPVPPPAPPRLDQGPLRRPGRPPPADLLHRALRALLASVRSGAATASLPAALARTTHQRMLHNLGKRRIVVDRNRHRPRKTKTREAFKPAGRDIATTIEQAVLVIPAPAAA